MAPKRKNVKKLMTTDLQGEGSFVVFKQMTLGEREDLQEEGRALVEAHRVDDEHDPEAKPEYFRELGERTIASHLVEWNWVDDDGNPLPLPSEDMSVLRQLTDDESAFISSLFDPARNQKK